jgi:antitoxin component YwqK of YwqJK toxin-antitoxin module
MKLSSFYKNGRLDGTFKTWYENGEPFEEYTFKNDLKTGAGKEFALDENNKSTLSHKLNYIDGKMHLEQMSFYPNGQKKAVINYEYGVLNGPKQLFDENGKILEEAYYIQDNLDGRYQTVKPNGMLAVYHYKNNLLNGLHQLFYPKNEQEKTVKSLEANYKNGLIDGELSEYNKEGHKIHRTLYKNGVKDGISVAYFEDGKTHITMTYKNNLLNGTVTEYFPNGKIKRTTPYLDGLKEGKETSYHENGVIASVGHYKKGKKDGLFQSWNYSEILTFEAEFSDDLRNGKFNKYDQLGKPKVLSTYNLDKLVEKTKMDELDVQ